MILEEKERQVYHYEAPSSPFRKIPKPYFAGFWIRFFAYIVDLIVIAALNGIIVNPILRVLQVDMSGGLFSLVGFVKTILFLLYFILMTKFFAQTLGKIIFGLKVIREDGEKLTWLNVLFREGALRFIQKTILPLYFVVAFTPHKQGVADLMEKTAVVHENLMALSESRLMA
ncbi:MULTISPECIES: RDD family protein [Listeria]|uniref:RDD family protein n=1 Tax=Listeria TaxID=1637 RepID=UPI001FC98CBB|nr:MULTISPECIES: RDD family protein [Listeria]